MPTKLHLLPATNRGPHSVCRLPRPSPPLTHDRGVVAAATDGTVGTVCVLLFCLLVCYSLAPLPLIVFRPPPHTWAHAMVFVCAGTPPHGPTRQKTRCPRGRSRRSCSTSARRPAPFCLWAPTPRAFPTVGPTCTRMTRPGARCVVVSRGVAWIVARGVVCVCHVVLCVCL
jgi:hypothetical protein